MYQMPNVYQISPNFTHADLGFVRVWYSYKTVIAFQWRGGPTRVCENVWGTTTGKHINTLADKKSRMKFDEFMVEWRKGPPNAIDHAALAALAGDPMARDLILDTIDKGK